MRISEKLLLSLSHNPSELKQQAAAEEWTVDNALSVLKRVFPDFKGHISGKVICDLGCGTGYQTVALAKAGAGRVIGIDMNAKRISRARELARENGLAGKTDFFTSVEEHHKGQFDIVISQNSFEHFPAPMKTLEDMKALLNPTGEILITFGPPWFAPYGSHMQFFTNLPWVNLIFDEKTVMNVRKHFRQDGATRYEEVESGLNKMTVAKFERIIAQCGMRIEYKKYECVKGVDFLGRLPLIRELFINHISCILKAN